MIRPARAEDAAAIAHFWNPVIRNTAVTFNSAEKTPDEIATYIAATRARGHGFFVGEVEGAVLGFASYGQFRASVGYARTLEHTVILAPEARGQGLGRALMLALEDHARAGGGHSLIAGVSGENEAGIAFHKAIGFAETARLPEVGWKFDRWMDLVLLQKFL